MTTREYLESVKKLDDKINTKLIQIQNIRDMATNTSPVQGDGSSHLGVSDKVGNAIEQIIDIDAEINKLVDELVNLKRNIILVSTRMSSVTYKEALVSRYINYDSYSKIADKLAREHNIVYTADTIRCSIVPRAIKEFETVQHNMLYKLYKNT